MVQKKEKTFMDAINALDKGIAKVIIKIPNSKDCQEIHRELLITREWLLKHKPKEVKNGINPKIKSKKQTKPQLDSRFTLL